MFTNVDSNKSFYLLSYEQRIEAPDKNYQYLLFAADPYETIGFKIPNLKIDKDPSRFFSNWDKDGKTFTLQLYFSNEMQTAGAPPPPPTGGKSDLVLRALKCSALPMLHVFSKSVTSIIPCAGAPKPQKRWQGHAA
jgi:hypothetical protein